jgi:hypothetical protein
MRIALSLFFLFSLLCGLEAQTPQGRLTYEDRSEASGHVLILNGKSYGPYKEILSSTFSTSATAIVFAVSKRDKVWILAQGKETGPLPVGFDLDRLQVSDDGKVWILTATRTGTDQNDPDQTLLWVNGKSYGPYPELTTVEYAETGGNWIAAVRTASDEADVLWSGKPLGPFFSVDHAWLAPDGKTWGYAVSDSEGKATVVTSEKTWTGVLSGNFTYLYPREPHWGYSLDLGTQGQRIVVDGQPYEGYRDFRGLVLTPSGRHWAFEAEKVSPAGDSPVVVVDGKEYPGETLVWSRLGSQETFSWTVQDQDKVTIQSLKLP